MAESASFVKDKLPFSIFLLRNVWIAEMELLIILKKLVFLLFIILIGQMFKIMMMVANLFLKLLQVKMLCHALHKNLIQMENNVFLVNSQNIFQSLKIFVKSVRLVKSLTKMRNNVKPLSLICWQNCKEQDGSPIIKLFMMSLRKEKQYCKKIKHLEAISNALLIILIMMELLVFLA